ncbi:hypothetical protein NS228_19855 [Methylobacterium indicum]|nr:hypothetical protein NS228_19855 [Methylobacterium indicum]KTS38554.1 hypothetical protein NS229_03310 [Methylobacterium indicum]KTS52257.1 hypothetical protein NS230_10745 [Methylobacterium indicum]
MSSAPSLRQRSSIGPVVRFWAARLYAGRRFWHRPVMSLRACLVLALLTGLAGLALRLAVPVTPVDQDYRDVVAFYRAMPAGSGH